MEKVLQELERNIRLIKELGEKIIPFPDMLTYTGENQREVKVLSGAIHVETLVRDKNFTVVKAIIEADTVMDWHKHPQNETVLVCSGQLLFETEEGIVVLSPKEIFSIKPNTLHKVRAGEKTVSVTVLIPAEDSL